MPTQSLTDQLRLLEEEITKHDEAATKGPWHSLKYPDVKTHTVAAETSIASKLTIADADFIAFARTALLDLLAVAKGLEAESRLANKVALQMTVRLHEVADERDALRAENEALESKLKKANATIDELNEAFIDDNI